MEFKYDFATKEELELIHEKTLYLLKNVGIAFHGKEAREIFKQHGARIDGDNVFLEESLINKGLSTVIQKFDWHGRGSKVTIGDGSTIHAPSYGPMFVYEDDEYRYPTPLDFSNFHKLDASSKVMDVGSPNIMDLPSIDTKVRSDYAMASTLLYHTKPVLGIADGEKKSRECIKMVREFYDLHDKSVVCGLVDAASPFVYSEAMSEALVEYAKESQIIVFTGTGMSGLTTPDTIASSILAVNAAMVAGIVLAQLINPGTPVVYGNQGFGSDLRHSLLTVGSPEDSLIAYTIKSLGNFYNVPVRTGGCISDAKDVDMQAGIESFNSCFATLASNTDLMFHTCGVMDSYNGLSYDKYIYDEEVTESVYRFLRGYEVTEKTLMVDKLEKAGPGGNFIARTSKAYRNDYYLPKVPNRASHGNWIAEGKPSIKANTKKIYKERLANYVLPELNAAQQKIIETYVPKEFRY
ncbi:MAG: trimethylamine methyltransferase family protein [Eubacterium sp.]